jgi:hypothetical protein
MEFNSKSHRVILTLSFISFLGVDCKDDPLPPCTDCPQPIDTTTHNWVFEPPQFLGDGASSALYDAAIINDTLAYAVGGIYLKDSTGQIDPVNYNFAKWDGKIWTIQRVSLQLYNQDCTVAGTYFGKMVTIFAFDDGKVIMTDGADVILYDGSSFTHLPCSNATRNGAFIKFWGSSLNNLYAVGYTGTICHYNGSAWTKIPSATNLSFRDIYGATDSKTGEQQILALCSENIPHERGLYRLQGNIATALSTYPLNYDLVGLWFVPNKHYYLVGSGIFEKNSLSEETWKPDTLSMTRYTTTRIKGNGVNDVFIVGAFGECLHWNGKNWRSFRDQTALVYGAYSSVAIRGNIVIAVGNEYPLAAITIGRKK